MTLSLYFVERPVTETWFGEDFVKFYHAYLALVEEAINISPKILEEIHFKNEGHMRLKIHDRENGFIPDLQDLPNWGHIGGDDGHIKDIWQRVKGKAQEIDAAHIDFDGERRPDSANCRAACIALLDAIGLEYVPVEGVDNAPGSEANLAQIMAQKQQGSTPDMGI